MDTHNHTHHNMRIAAALLAGALASGAMVMAGPERPIFASERGAMMVFPGDSLDLAAATFTIDGDTVAREAFFSLDRAQIRTLTVVPSPANLIEVTTRAAAARPLPPDSLPADIDYLVDGTAVDRAAFSAIPPEAIMSITVVKGPRPRMEITTTAPKTPRVHVD